MRGLLTTTDLLRRLQEFGGGLAIRHIKTPREIEDRRNDLIPASIQLCQEVSLFPQRPRHTTHPHQTHPVLLKVFDPILKV